MYYSTNQSTHTLWYFHDTDFGKETIYDIGLHTFNLLSTGPPKLHCMDL